MCIRDSVLRSMWERGWSFIKKAGTIILLSSILVWFTSYFGFVDGQFTMLEDTQLDHSILASIGNAIAWIFTPLGCCLLYTSIARAIAKDVDLILADEPTGNLDEKNSKEILKTFIDLAHQANKCIIIVTHSPSLAQKCDVQLKIEDGQIVEI